MSKAGNCKVGNFCMKMFENLNVLDEIYLTVFVDILLKLLKFLRKKYPQFYCTYKAKVY